MSRSSSNRDSKSSSLQADSSNESYSKLTAPNLSTRKSSTVLLHSTIEYNKNYASDPTTAINLENVSHTVFDSTDETDIVSDSSRLRASRSNRYSTASERSFTLSYNDSSPEEDNNVFDNDYHDEEDLQNLLSDLIKQRKNSYPTHNGHSEPANVSFLDLNMFENKNNLPENEFYERYIKINKSADIKSFHEKLKHFFILSTAGKPVYSMNGSDDIIMGYMGLITTIVSTFEEHMQENIKSINFSDNLNIVVMKKDPLIFVAITKLEYETMSSNGNNDLILSKQLNILYSYLLAILSKPTILKNFYNRMNFDLRKVLTPLDFHNFDSLCMKLTYGLSTTADANVNDISGFDNFISELLDSSLQSVKITNTTRTKLNSILFSCKKLKSQTDVTKETVDNSTSFFRKESVEKENFLGEDLLFSLLTTISGKIISSMKPKNHTLSNEDLKILFSMISSIATQPDGMQLSEDLWIPLCMPNFNQNGFLYVFVKKFDLAKYVQVDGINVSPQPITIILISSNKNSFFQMQEISKYIIYKITKSEVFRNKLSKELLESNRLPILQEIKVPDIKHFIYKSKKYNQFVMSDFSEFEDDNMRNTILSLVYFYSNLHNTKATLVNSNKPASSNSLSINPSPNINKNFNKKFTYTKWDVSGHSITGYMLSDNTYEFYCLCYSSISSKDLISHCLKIIKWCQKYDKRLFIGNGIIF